MRFGWKALVFVSLGTSLTHCTGTLGDDVSAERQEQDSNRAAGEETGGIDEGESSGEDASTSSAGGSSAVGASGSNTASTGTNGAGSSGSTATGGSASGGLTGNPNPGDVPTGPAVVDDGTVTARVTASRITGVAPLSVLFDATSTTGGTRAFHDLQYVWDFGDPDSGSWAQTGHGKNSATGGVAAHVFDKPGTYTVKLTVRNAKLVGSAAEVTITVSDPNTVFTGTNTVCFANGSDFTGCPQGARQVSTSDTTAIQNAVAKNRRLLLRRGDTFSLSSPIEATGVAPFAIGAFGTCSAPDARGICTNAPKITTSATGDTTVITTGDDVRVMDLSLAGAMGDSDTAAVGISGRASLVYRVHTRGFQTAVRSAFSQTVPDQLAIVSSDIGYANSNNVYVGSERLMLLGNHLHDATASHVLRVWSAYKGTISENLIENASIGGSNGRHALKLHGLAEGDGGGADGLLDGTSPNGGALQRTRLVHISDNTFGASPPWPVSIGPQFDGIDERVSDVIFERNFFRVSGTVYPGSSPVDTPIHCNAAGDITVRNNIFDATGAGQDFAAFDVSRDSVSPPTVPNILFLNNLVYRSDKVGTQVVMVRLGAGVQNAVVRNNVGVASAYADSGKRVVDNAGTGTVIENNQYIANPNFAASPPVTAFDFRPLAGAGTIDKGIAGAVIDDFSRTVRAGSVDLGPFEYVAP